VSDRALGWVEAAIAFPYLALNRDRRINITENIVEFADRGEFDRFSCG
jgi:hypothetical protein